MTAEEQWRGQVMIVKTDFFKKLKKKTNMTGTFKLTVSRMKPESLQEIEILIKK